MIAQTMLAIEIRAAGGPEVLQATTRPTPVPGPGQVLIRVRYAGVNRHDCGQRKRGFGPVGATDIPGLEVSGEVAALGEGVKRWKVGDALCALVNGGGYAEYCLAQEALCLAIPEGFTLQLAAALPEALLTAWFNVFYIGRLEPHQWLLVHGGSSGVGSLAIKLAVLLHSKVIATVGNEAKRAFCLSIGASEAINYRNEDFVKRVHDITQGKGVNVILDMVGGAYAKRNIEALAMDGRVMHLSSGDSDQYSVPLAAIMAKRVLIGGSQLRASSLETKIKLIADIEQKVGSHLGRSVLPVIDSEFALIKASQAHQRMETSEHVGKIILSINP